MFEFNVNGKAVCPSISWAVIFPSAGLIGSWPDRNNKFPVSIPWEYGPMAFGAFSVFKIVFISIILLLFKKM